MNNNSQVNISSEKERWMPLGVPTYDMGCGHGAATTIELWGCNVQCGFVRVILPPHVISVALVLFASVLKVIFWPVRWTCPGHVRDMSGTRPGHWVL